MLLLAGCGTKEVGQKTSNSNQITDNGLIQKTGVYNGMADNHTIEVSIDGDVLSLQVEDSLEPELSKINDGDQIKVEYTNKNVLKSINKISK